jgi:hypothetical protein
MINLNWSEFKYVSQQYSLKMNMVELPSQYLLSVYKHPFTLQCILVKGSPDCVEFETTYKATTATEMSALVKIESAPPFGAKMIGDKRLYKRVHGVQHDCIVGENIIDFEVPYPAAKITGLEVMWASEGDTCDLQVLDTPTGTISTIPSYILNQFGFTVCVSKDKYEHRSEYDADLIQGMKLRVKITAVAAKKIGINFILNEVK